MPKRKRNEKHKLDNLSMETLADDERELISPLHPPINRQVHFEDARISSDYPLADVFTADNRNHVNENHQRLTLGTASFMDPSHVADLGPYIRAVRWRREMHSVLSREPIFHEGVGHWRPRLQRGRVNRIILYPGCFNPPHRGHQALLDGAFWCSHDIGVIAAIVLPVGDNGGLKDKKYACNISFTYSERVRLWRGDQGAHDWMWVYDGLFFAWNDFRERLTSAIERDGFAVEFVWLGGPDHASVDTHEKRSGCKKRILGNVGREADFVRQDGTLKRLDNCTAWKPVSIDEEIMLRESKKKAKWLLDSLSFTMSENVYKALVEELNAEYADRMKNVSICYQEHASANWWIRYIPPGRNGLKKISSTDIRRVITQSSVDQLCERLEGRAIHPEILAQLVQGKRTKIY